MATNNSVAKIRKITQVCLVATMFLFSGLGQAAQGNKTTTVKDEQGWKLQVDGKDFYVKGMVWGYSPRGVNFTYNLWGESDELIKNVLDHDFGLMAEAGVTAIRSFTIIPPEWVTYIYETHGILSVINPLMGRYGANIGGVWKPNTNYADPLTRETLKAESLAVVEQYKDVPGVFMFAYGNESNYGLSWSSFEIEDLPVGEQNREKAKYLYSLWGEVIKEAQQVAPDQAHTIVNGDIQYLDLIAEYLPHMEVLGTNAYRGIGFTDMWQRVKEEYDRPIVFMEFGSDAFNAKNFAEDQEAQASYLKGQWQDMYHNSYGGGGYGNAIGGMVFEWRDEWWKYRQTENLDIQDRNASWANGGYKFDFVEGQNNMNEEWFGVARLGDANAEGVYVAHPRMAYYVLQEIWRIDPYVSSREVVNETVQNVDMDFLSLRSEFDALRQAKAESDRFRLIGGSVQGDFIAKGDKQSIDADDEDGFTTSDGLMAFLDFGFQPTNRISGRFSVNVLANVVESDFEFRYGDRGKPITVNTLTTNSSGVTVSRETELEGRERVEIYDFEAKYEGESADLLTFYHVPRFHWGYEGDFFGLLKETTDMEGQDIWNDKAPYGMELIGKKNLDGLKFLIGPEVYWGANPKAMLKYEFAAGGNEYAVVLAEDIAERDSASGSTEATVDETRQATIYGKFGLTDDIDLELGGIISGTERIDDEFDRLEGSNIVVDEVEFEDTLGAKAKLSFGVFGASRAYIAANYAGIVADAGDPLREFGTELPYSALGNKREAEAGIMMVFGDFTVFPRGLYRENIVESNGVIDPAISGTTLTPGINARNRDDDPFSVLENRAATSGELYITYDPTPETSFYHWNVDMLENAGFAANAGFTYTEYKTATDAYTFRLEEFDTNAAFGAGIEADDLWLFKSKLIYNPSRKYRFITDLEAGKQQSTGDPGRSAVEYYSIHGKLIVDKKHIVSGYVEKDAFGQYDFFREFNITFPWQYKIDYAYLLDQYASEKRSSKVGVRAFYRTLDEFSPEDDYDNGNNDYQVEIGTYFEFNF